MIELRQEEKDNRVFELQVSSRAFENVVLGVDAMDGRTVPLRRAPGPGQDNAAPTGLTRALQVSQNLSNSGTPHTTSIHPLHPPALHGRGLAPRLTPRPPSP